MKKKIIEKLTFIKTHWVSLVQFQLLTFMMTMGFYLTYCLIWFGIGLPQTKWALFILALVAVGTEWTYLWWVKRSH